MLRARVTDIVAQYIAIIRPNNGQTFFEVRQNTENVWVGCAK